MCFNNGFVIEVLLFPKQVQIVLGLVSVTPEVLPLLRRKAVSMQMIRKQFVRQEQICKNVNFCLFLHFYK